MIRMPIPTRKRALELAASMIERDLHEMRKQAQERFETRRERGDQDDGREYPLTTSLEGDLMKAVEWASAAATLREMAAQEDSR